jgi:hypothetical protein
LWLIVIEEVKDGNQEKYSRTIITVPTLKKETLQYAHTHTW